MYEQFYGLRELPFELGSNLRFLFLPQWHREALSNLQYAIESRKGVTVLTGDAGTGKTTLVRAAIANAGSASHCVHMTNPRLSGTEFVAFLATKFDLGSAVAASKVACLGALVDRLLERRSHGEHTTLIIDEAQAASDDLLEEIRLLTNLESPDERLLSIILVGQPEFGERLNEPAYRHLKQRVALRCALRPLTLQETAAYIASRIRTAGGSAASVFTGEAVQLIFKASGGIPRLISVLCDNALLTGFAVGERPVHSRVVQDVCRDFHLESRDIAADDAVGPDQRARTEVPPENVVLRAPAPPVAETIVRLDPVSQMNDSSWETMFGVATLRRRFGIF